MKHKLFHKGFYLDTLLRIKVFSIFTVVFSVVIAAVNAFIMLSDYLVSVGNGGTAEIKILSLFDIAGVAGGIATIFVPILTFIAFAHLYRRNESDFFETIPVKREAMAFSGTLSVLTVLLASVVGSVLVYILITIPCIGKVYIIDPISFFLELLAVLIASMFSVSISLLGIAVTGVIGSGAIVTASIALIPRLIMSSFLKTLEGWDFSLVKDNVIPLFNSSMNIHYALLTGKFLAQQTPWNYVYTGVISVVIYVIATFLFVKRGSESISHKFGNNTCRHIAAILLAMLPMSYSIAPFFDFEEAGFLGIILAIVSVVVFIVFEIFGNDKRRKNRGGITAFIVLVVITIAYSFGINATHESLESYSPKAEDIEYISVVSTSGESDFLGDLFDDYGYLNYQEYAEMRAESIEIRDREVAEIISKALTEKGEESDEDKRTLTVKIMSLGKIHYRKVHLTAEDYSRVETVLSSNDKYNEIWQNVDDGARYPSAYYEGTYINYDMLGNVLQTMEAEIVKYGVDRYRASVYYELSVCEIDYTIYNKGKEYTVSVPVFEYMDETIKKLETARKTIAENEISDLNSKLDAIVSGELSADIIVNYYGETSSCYLTVSSGNQEIDVRKFTNELKSFVSSETRESSHTIYISLYSNELWGSDYYYTLSVDSSISEDAMEEFFLRYGGTVYK